MRSYLPSEHPIPVVHQLLLSGVAPRPIALVSSLDTEGRNNLSPFSYYNAFGANPPVITISPAFRAGNGIPKHTFLNILETREFTVSAVSYAMVEQVSLASSDYERGVDEFVKAGFTKRASSIVAPPGVAESPFVMECRLLHHIDTGGKPGAGNLLVAEVVMFHVKESSFENDKMDPRRLDLVSRMGHAWYCRANGDALFELPKPRHNGIGIDALPLHMRDSSVFTGNDLGRFAGSASVPDAEKIRGEWKRDISRLGISSNEADMFEAELRMDSLRSALLIIFRCISDGDSETMILSRLQRLAQAFLRAGDVERAWACALMSAPEELAFLRR